MLKRIIFILVLGILALNLLYSQSEVTSDDLRSAILESNMLKDKGQNIEAKETIINIFADDPLLNNDVILKSVMENPLYYDAAKTLGSIEMQSGNYDEGLEIYNQLLSVKESTGINDGDIYNRMGWANYQNKDYETSINFFQMALSTDEAIDELTKEKALNNLGLAYFALGEYDQAKEAFMMSEEIYKSSFAAKSLEQVELLIDE